MTNADTSNVRCAHDRFEETRRAVDELNEINLLIMYDGDDWKPDDVRVPGVSNPTEARAIHNVDEWGEQLIALRKRQAELMDFIGISLVLVRRVRDGLGDKYADVLEQRYVDCQKWTEIAECYESNHKDKSNVTTRTVKNWAQIAFDWIDSVGVSRMLSGQVEL